MACERLETRGSRRTLVVGLDLREDVGVVADEVDLVDHQHHVLHADEDEDEAVPARLGQDALARIDQHQREIGVGGAGRHVAGILLVARRVGDDELALVGREEPVGDVDGDALLALGREAVDQQREVDALVADVAVLALLLEAGELVVEDELAVVEQPADQRRLAVVDGAAGQEPQQAFVGLLGEPEIEIGVGRGEEAGHQKYPSCFFFSIEPTESLSIRRPSRSEVRRRLHFHDDRGQVLGGRADGAGQRVAAEGAEADHFLARRLARARAACGRHRP